MHGLPNLKIPSVCFWRDSPQWVMTSSVTRFLDHTQRRSTVSRTPQDEWSARRRDLYLTTHNTHNRQTSMPPVGFEPTISAGERPHTYDLDRAASTFHVAIIKFDFQASFFIVCWICFLSFRGWYWWVSEQIIFSVWGCQPHGQPPTWRTTVSLFVWVIILDLSGMGGPTSSMRYRQHSSRGHKTTQAPPLRQSRDTVGRNYRYYCLKKYWPFYMNHHVCKYRSVCLRNEMNWAWVWPTQVLCQM